MSQAVVVYAFNPSTHSDLCQFEARLSYRASSRTARAVSKNKQTKNKKFRPHV